MLVKASCCNYFFCSNRSFPCKVYSAPSDTLKIKVMYVSLCRLGIILKWFRTSERKRILGIEKFSPWALNLTPSQTQTYRGGRIGKCWHCGGMNGFLMYSQSTAAVYLSVLLCGLVTRTRILKWIGWNFCLFRGRVNEYLPRLSQIRPVAMTVFWFRTRE